MAAQRTGGVRIRGSMVPWLRVSILGGILGVLELDAPKGKQQILGSELDPARGQQNPVL